VDEKKPEFEYAIICDDIRHEMGDKFSLIGVYGSDIYVAQLPFLFPKLSAAISCLNMRGGDTFVIELRDPKGQAMAEAISGKVPTEVKGPTRFMIFGVFPPLRLAEPGLYKLMIVINGDEASRREVRFMIKAADSRVLH
jgi:hypothetical protein